MTETRKLSNPAVGQVWRHHRLQGTFTILKIGARTSVVQWVGAVGKNLLTTAALDSGNFQRVR